MYIKFKALEVKYHATATLTNYEFLNEGKVNWILFTHRLAQVAWYHDLSCSTVSASLRGLRQMPHLPPRTLLLLEDNG